jgi:hypothetical protein
MSLGLLVAWSLLVASQIGWLPFTRFAWAFNLWSYLPAQAAWLLAAAALSLCVPRVRSSLASGFAAAARRWPAGGAAEAAACALVAAFLWLLREHELIGDSGVIAIAAHEGHAFVFPEVGATFLVRSAYQLGLALGVEPVEAIRALACLCGGAMTWLLLRIARELAPGSAAAAIALLIFSGGFSRIFAGRIEVYAPLLVAVAAYLWAALRALRVARSLSLPALCLGVAIWLHAAAVLLGPSLLALGWLRPERRRGRDAWREAAGVLLLAGAPLAVFLMIQGLVAGSTASLTALTRVLEILGRSDDTGAIRWWVRGWGGAPSIGTDVVWLSAAHLKYLVNASSLLIPACLPALLFLLVRRPRALVADATGRWLAIAALPLCLYATLLRPFWGPWDWDLFALTAFVLACVCIRALAALRVAPELAVATIGFQLCFVGVPFLWIGAGTARDVGPYGFRSFDYDLRQPARPPPAHIAPWL